VNAGPLDGFLLLVDTHRSYRRRGEQPGRSGHMRVHRTNPRTYTAGVKSCAVCGAPNPEGAHFCVQCGAALAAPCANCGAEIPEGAKFCPACGRRVEQGAPAGEERKVVTILFSDVAGSTALGERLDPERLKEVIGAYFDAMRREIEAEGGTVEKFVGDAVMAVFGVPVAHEDDPRRALRAALRMRRALEELNLRLDREHGVMLAMRTGVNTGEVVAEPAPRAGQGMVAGDAVNVAARLEQAAESGQILASERTARSARGLVFRALGPLMLKGKEEPVRAFELVGDGEVPPPGLRPTEGAVGYPAPLVGREHELDLLRAVHERACSEGRTHLVTIYGEPGVGKSRLMEEFEGWAAGLPEPPTVLRGRCLPYGEGVTYWPLAEILKGEAGVLDSDPPDLALEKVHKLAGALLAEVPGLQEPNRAVSTLAFTVGLTDPSHRIDEFEPHVVRTAVHEAWRSYFWALARRGPVLVEVEDIHWADPALLDLLEEVAERSEGPLVFVCSSRHELTVRRPDWGGGRRNFSSVLLDPLSDADAGRLLDLLLGEEDVAEALRERILDRAGGNPFFLEEIVRHVVDERLAVAAEDGWRAATEMEAVDIPDTVQGVLAARMDLLPPTEKRILQSAAVVGRVFWTGPVGTLLEVPAAESEVLDALARLQDRGLVHARMGSTVEGEREYSFRHILTRDVAYESLPRRDRATKHALVADWLEDRAGKRQTEFAELLAHHYLEAYRGLAAEARSDPAEVERLRALAFRFVLTAANEARTRLVLEQAERFAESALALAAGPEERSSALEALGMSYLHDSRGDLAWECLKEAIDLRAANQDGASAGRDPAIARVCAEALEVATRHRGVMRRRLPREEVDPYLAMGLRSVGEEDSEERARLLVAKAFWPYAFRDMDLSEVAMDEARETAEEAAAMAFRQGRLPLASAALDAVCSTYHLVGRYGPMTEPIQRRLELAPSLSDPWELGDIHAFAAWFALNTGQYREAARLGSVGMDLALAGSRIMGLYCLDFRAMARLRLGEWDMALADVALADEILGDRRDAPPGFASMHVAAAAFIHEVRGDQGSANRYLQLLDWLEKTEERPDVSWTLWRSRALARRGEFAEARALLERPQIAGDFRGRDEVLEAWCELLTEEEAWDDAARVVGVARSHAEWAGVPPLAVYADRLEGRVALATGDPGTAVAFLERAADAFAGMEAEWEAAVTWLDLARALATAGRPEDARAALDRAVPTLDRLRSLRELVRAGELLTALAGSS
jgi:class 3 adenylate cyclase/tetratricopeptide (TPR) repeat protein